MSAPIGSTPAAAGGNKWPWWAWLITIIGIIIGIWLFEKFGWPMLNELRGEVIRAKEKAASTKVVVEPTPEPKETVYLPAPAPKPSSAPVVKMEELTVNAGSIITQQTQTLPDGTQVTYITFRQAGAVVKGRVTKYDPRTGKVSCVVEKNTTYYNGGGGSAGQMVFVQPPAAPPPSIPYDPNMEGKLSWSIVLAGIVVLVILCLS